jgi:hypothetical protein
MINANDRLAQEENYSVGLSVEQYAFVNISSISQ